MSSLPMKDKGCLLSHEDWGREGRKRPTPKLGHASAQQPDGYCWWEKGGVCVCVSFGRRGFEILDYFLSKFFWLFSEEREKVEMRWCAGGKGRVGRGGAVERKGPVLSHTRLIELLQTPRKTAAAAAASDKPPSRETAGSRQTRGRFERCGSLSRL